MSAASEKPASGTILIVDDDPTQRLLARETLERKGYRIEEADRGDTGFEMALAHRPDLMLIDVVMPGMDGFTLCEKIRATPQISRTPLILVTSLEEPNSVETGFHAGANDFLVKPILWPLLGYRVQFALRAAKMEQDLRDAHDEAETASRAKSMILNNMSHELRTPLNAIIGFSAFLRDRTDPSPDSDTRRFLDDIHSSGQRLLATVNDVLDMAQLLSGRIELNREDVEVTHVIAPVARRFAELAATKSLTIDCPDCTGLPAVQADPDLLRRVVASLLSNAIKFSENGRISIVAKVEGAELHIGISDEGHGMCPEDLQRILEPFNQLDESLSRSNEGAGLGVPLARAILDRHGGRLEYRSKPGVGTTAIVVLPLEAPKATEQNMTRNSDAAA